MPSSFHRLILFILLAIGSPFLIIAVWEGVETWRDLERFRSARGTVVDNSYVTTQDGTALSGADIPVVEFATAEGERVRFSDGIGSLPADYEIGERVDLYYDPLDPPNARIRSWKRLWLAPMLLAIVGTLPVALYVCWIWRDRRSGRA